MDSVSGPPAAVDPHLRQGYGGRTAGSRVGEQRVRERFSTSGEDRLHHRLKRFRIADCGLRSVECQPDERRADLGRRPKRARRQGEEPVDSGVKADEYGQDAEVLRPRRRRQPVGDFALKHESRVDERRPGCEHRDKFEHDRRGHVVR